MESSTPVNVSNRSASTRATSTASATTRFASRSNRALRPLIAGILACVAIATGDSLAFGDSGTALSELPVLEARLERVSTRDDAKYALGAIEQARRALSRAGQPDQDPAAAVRSIELARAALVLSERQLERRRTQEALFETQRRLTATKERAEAQRRVLEALLRERATLAREADRP